MDKIKEYIYSPSGEVLHEVVLTQDCKRKFSLMSEDSITLVFSLDNPVSFPIGSRFRDFYITKDQNGLYNPNTGVYDYSLKFDAYYWQWANKVLKYSTNTANAPAETSFSLTANIALHASVIIKALDKLGYKFDGSPFGVNTSDSSLSAEAKLVKYENVSILGGIQAIAETFECEWWVLKNVIYFGKCRHENTPFEFEAGVNVSSISFSESKDSIPNRLYVFGSNRNLPTNYRETATNDTIDGIVNKRLMLPQGVPYLQSRSNIPESEIVEKVVTFESVYPRMTLSVNGKPESYTSDANNEDGTVTTQIYYRIKTNNEFKFSNAFILPHEELKIRFTSGLLNGMEFGARFNPKGVSEKIEEEWNPEAQLYEIVANEDYGRILPDAVLKPESGNSFILIGWDSTKIADLGLVSAAEKELLEEGKKALDEYAKDLSTCTCPMAWDYMKPLITTNSEPKLGDAVIVKDSIHFGEGGRKSRIIGYEYSLDVPYAEMSYTVGENVSVSRLKNIEDKIEGLAKTGEILYTQNSLDYLSKRRADRTPYRLATDTSFDIGDFLAGVSGGRFGIDKTDNKSFLEVDYLHARVRAYFEQLTIINADTVAGRQYITPGGSVKCTKVEETATTYLCFFLSGQDGEKTETYIKAGDQAIAEMFNAKVGTTNKVSNHRWWRLVTSVQQSAYRDDAGNYYGYIEVSKEDCEKNSDIPCEGDVICQLGARNDSARQAAMIFDTVGSSAPSISLLTGIGSGTTNAEYYSLSNKDIISYGYDKAKNNAYFNVYGDTYIGAKDGSTFIKYDKNTNQLDIKARISASSTIGDQSIDQYIHSQIPENPKLTEQDILNLIGGRLNDLQSQIDGAIETWYAEGEPTLLNEPAKNWSKDEYEAHSGDLYYDKINGLAYRFQKDANEWVWVLIKDTDIAAALANAAVAQETADGKMKVFYTNANTLPVPPYQVGDIWVNATYTKNGKTYSNDILRCITERVNKGTEQISDWTLASKYTDDTAANEAKAAIAGYSYLKDAFQDKSLMIGGILLTSLIKLGIHNEGLSTQKVYAGINGIYQSNELGGGIGSWWGGDMIDLFNSDGTIKTGNTTLNAATSLIRMDGSAYFGNGNIGFEKDGSGWLANHNIWWNELGAITFGNGIKIDLGSNKTTTLGELGFKLDGLNASISSLTTLMNTMSNHLTPMYKDSTGYHSTNWGDISKGSKNGGHDLAAIKSSAGFYSEKFLSTLGVNDLSIGGSGLIQSIYRIGDLGKSFSDSANDTFNAYTINSIDSRVKSLETGSALTFTTSGSGNAITSVTKSGNAVTLNKGAKFVSIDPNGVSEIGRYIDFHSAADGSSANEDYTVRLYGGSTTLRSFIFPESGGTIATESFVTGKGYISSASDVLAKLRTVDGAGSGMDADLLDGLHSSDFTRIKTVKMSSDKVVRISLLQQACFVTINGTNGDRNAAIYAYGYGDGTLTRNCIRVIKGNSNYEFYINGSSENSCIYIKSLWPDNNDVVSVIGFGEIAPQSSVPSDSTKITDSSYLAARTDNVASASKLAKTCKLWGQPFNGEGDVSGDLSGLSKIKFTNEIFLTTSLNELWNDGTYSHPWYGYHKIHGLKGVYATTISDYFGICLKTGLGVMAITEAGNVGIGTTEPNYRLDISGTLRATGQITANSGVISNGEISSSKANAFRAVYGGYGFIIRNDGDKAFFLMTNKNDTYGEFNSLRPMSIACDSGMVSLCNGVTITQSGYSGAVLTYDINNKMIHSTHGFYSDGAISAKGVTSSSDIRLKNVMGKLSIDLRRIASAPAVYFNWRKDGIRDVGSIAQYWESVVPELVNTDSSGFKSLDYGKTALLSVISTANKTMDNERRISILEKENKELKMEVKLLKKKCHAL